MRNKFGLFSWFLLLLVLGLGIAVAGCNSTVANEESTTTTQFGGTTTSQAAATTLTTSTSTTTTSTTSSTTTTVILSGNLLYTLSGPANSQFGWSVANIGDINGDGKNDFAVGAPESANGAVYIYSGANGGLLASIEGEASGDGFGYSLASVPDVNSDGVKDILIGASHYSSGGGARSAYVYSGATRAQIHKITRNYTGGGFGYSLAGLGDINGDSRADFVVSDNRLGTVEVFSGIDKAILLTITSEGSKLGWSTANAGDVNGDGKNDIVVCPTNNTPGRTLVYSGANGAQLFSIEVPEATYTIFSVNGLGDINGDGRSDFLAGFIDSLMLLNGEVYVYSGADGSVIFPIKVGGQATPVGIGVQFGCAVSGLTDVNGDGIRDLLIADREVSRAHVLSGANASTLYQVSDPVAGMTFYGVNIDDAGDLNGDGRGDFIVGAGLGNKAYVYTTQAQ